MPNLDKNTTNKQSCIRKGKIEAGGRDSRAETIDGQVHRQMLQKRGQNIQKTRLLSATDPRIEETSADPGERSRGAEVGPTQQRDVPTLRVRPVRTAPLPDRISSPSAFHFLLIHVLRIIAN